MSDMQTYWNKLRTSEQAKLFDYGLTLMKKEWKDITEEELIAKLERMHKCDNNQWRIKQNDK
jgi:hypothetical protein